MIVDIIESDVMIEIDQREKTTMSHFNLHLEII
jgi:hypothetical protein